MKLYISVDMEGITGLPDQTFVDSELHNYERSRLIMTEEVNAVVTTAFNSGCSEVLVNDSHSKMNNIFVDKLHPDAELITGSVKPLSMMQGIERGYDAAMLIGYHARAGQFGVMSHSMIHAVRNFYINDHQIGEMGFNAYVAGFFDTPVLLVSGDDQAVAEGMELIPNLRVASVKRSISRSCVKSLSPQKAQALLVEQTRKALENKKQISPLRPPENPVLRIEFNNYGQAEAAGIMPRTEVEPGTTIVRYEAKDIIEAYQAMLVMTELAMHVKFS